MRRVAASFSRLGCLTVVLALYALVVVGVAASFVAAFQATL